MSIGLIARLRSDYFDEDGNRGPVADASEVRVALEDPPDDGPSVEAWLEHLNASRSGKPADGWTLDDLATAVRARLRPADGWTLDDLATAVLARLLPARFVADAVLRADSEGVAAGWKTPRKSVIDGLPALSGQHGKVLSPTKAGDDLEWIEQTGGGSAGSGDLRLESIAKITSTGTASALWPKLPAALLIVVHGTDAGGSGDDVRSVLLPRSALDHGAGLEIQVGGRANQTINVVRAGASSANVNITATQARLTSIEFFKVIGPAAAASAAAEPRGETIGIANLGASNVFLAGGRLAFEDDRSIVYPDGADSSEIITAVSTTAGATTITVAAGIYVLELVGSLRTQAAADRVFIEPVLKKSDGTVWTTQHTMHGALAGGEAFRVLGIVAFDDDTTIYAELKGPRAFWSGLELGFYRWGAAGPSGQAAPIQGLPPVDGHLGEVLTAGETTAVWAPVFDRSAHLRIDDLDQEQAALDERQDTFAGYLRTADADIDTLQHQMTATLAKIAAVETEVANLPSAGDVAYANTLETQQFTLPGSTWKGLLDLSDTPTVREGDWRIGTTGLVVPKDGIYMLNSSLVVQPSSHVTLHMRFAAARDGVDVPMPERGGNYLRNAAGWQVAEHSELVRLFAGDQVYVQIEADSEQNIQVRGGESGFSIHRVSDATAPLPGATVHQGWAARGTAPADIDVLAGDTSHGHVAGIWTLGGIPAAGEWLLWFAVPVADDQPGGFDIGGIDVSAAFRAPVEVSTTGGAQVRRFQLYLIEDEGYADANWNGQEVTVRAAA